MQVPLFSELYAAKDLRSMIVERRHSLKAQRQAAGDARAYLIDSIEALEEHCRGAFAQHARGTPEFHAAMAYKRSYPTGPKTIGGIYGLAQRLEMRYTAQVKALDAETFRATAFLREMGSGDGGREIEVATSAHEADMLQKLAKLTETLRTESLQKMLSERAKGAVLTRLADLAASRL